METTKQETLEQLQPKDIPEWRDGYECAFNETRKEIARLFGVSPVRDIPAKERANLVLTRLIEFLYSNPS